MAIAPKYLYEEEEAARLVDQYLKEKNWKKIEELLNHENANYKRATTEVLTKYYVNKKEWSKIADLLKTKDVDIKTRVIIALRNAAATVDITAIVPALNNCLSDSEAFVRETAGSTLTCYYMNTNQWEKIKDLLTHNIFEDFLRLKNPDVRKGVLDAVSSGALGGRDISPIIPNLKKALYDDASTMKVAEIFAYLLLDKKNSEVARAILENGLTNKNEHVRESCAWAFLTAADMGVLISLAISSLENALSDTSKRVRIETAAALARHCVNKDEWKKIKQFLSNKDAAIRAGAANGLYRAAVRGMDITPVLQDLEKALDDKNKDVKRYVSLALEEYKRRGIVGSAP